MSDNLTETTIFEGEGAGDLSVVTGLAVSFGLREEDLDDSVSELANQSAAGAYNAGGRPDLDDDSAYDALHDDADRQASIVNNAGREEQLRFLLSALGRGAVEQLLRQLAGR